MTATGLAKRVVGIAHVHSTYSHDGRLGLTELAAVAARHRWSFMLVTEHSDSLTSDAFGAAEAECKALSHDDFLMFPSVEYTCEGNVHILGYNAGYIEDFPASPVALACAVRERGGLAVLAHPCRYIRRSPEVLTPDLLSAVSGVEVWNSKLAYDGPWVAPVRHYDLMPPGGIGFCGQDVHFYKHFSSLVIEMDVPALVRHHVMHNLASGRFRITNGRFSLDPMRSPGGRTRAIGRAAHAAANFALTQALRVRHVIKDRSAGPVRSRP